MSSMDTLWDEAIENPDGSRGARIARKSDSYVLLSCNLRASDLLVDSLHALYPEMMAGIPIEQQFRLYLEPLLQ